MDLRDRFKIPHDFPEILETWTREVLRFNPHDIVAFSKGYFESMAEGVHEQFLQQQNEFHRKYRHITAGATSQATDAAAATNVKSQRDSISDSDKHTMAFKLYGPVAASAAQQAHSQSGTETGRTGRTSREGGGGRMQPGVSRPEGDAFGAEIGGSKNQEDISQRLIGSMCGNSAGNVSSFLVYVSCLYLGLASENIRQDMQSCLVDPHTGEMDVDEAGSLFKRVSKDLSAISPAAVEDIVAGMAQLKTTTLFRARMFRGMFKEFDLGNKGVISTQDMIRSGSAFSAKPDEFKQLFLSTRLPNAPLDVGVLEFIYFYLSMCRNSDEQSVQNAVNTCVQTEKARVQEEKSKKA